QIWRQASGTTSKLARDVGYGMGWTLQAGSLFPGVDSNNHGYYLFTDATGAEYHLDQYNIGAGLWTSIDGTYVTFESGMNKLYFPDGSFWKMDVVSAPGEPDAGAMYPSLMEDSNGNQVKIDYDTGAGGSGSSSARILHITDVRAASGNVSYTLSYTSGHL